MRIFKRRIYMDYAAATPLENGAEKAMRKYARAHFGNAGSLHREGILAKNSLENAREDVADFFTAHSDEIVFTGGGTEANNIAIQGVFAELSYRLNGGRTSVLTEMRPPLMAGLSAYHAITSEIEHSSVKDVFAELEKRGLAVTYVGVSSDGHIDSKAVKNALRENTILVSIMHSNNEIGTVQPIREIAKTIRGFRKEKNEAAKIGERYPLFHTDAIQSALYMNVRPDALGVDLLTASPAKMYGPKGVGILYVRRGTPLAPIMYGGGQERVLRPGTENVAGAIGAAATFSLAAVRRDKESARLYALREYFTGKIQAAFPDAVINGDGEVLPHILNVSFPGFDNEEIVLRLDAEGISCSTKSACKSAGEEVSYVVAALGVGHYPESAVRFSMGRGTRKRDIRHTIGALKKIFSIMERAGK